jgi:hypothetical protein
MSPSLEEKSGTGSDWHGSMSLLSNMYFKCKLASKESHNSYNSLPMARWETHSVDHSFPCQLRANNKIQYGVLRRRTPTPLLDEISEIR